MAWQNVYVDIEATVSAQMEKTDNGLSGVHYREFAEPTNMVMETIHMFGREWTWVQLVNTFGRQGAEALQDLIIEQTDAGNWEDD